MTIALTDIPAAIDDYLQTQVTTTISPVIPTDPNQDVLTPGQKGKVTLTVTNSDATKGVRLVEPVYRFKVDDDSVLTLLAPGSVANAAFEDLELTKRIANGTPVKEMYVVPLINNIIDAGEQADSAAIVLCQDQGSTKVIGQFFAKVDQDSLFTTGHSENHHNDVEVQ